MTIQPLVLPELRVPESDQTWRPRGICGTSEVDFFSPRVADRAKAKKVCAECPVEVDCLNFAVINWEDFGVWGGTTGPERKAMRK